MKNITAIKVNWDEQKSLLKKRFAILTNKDFKCVEDNKEAMFEKLQITLGKTKEQLHKIIQGL
jgi:hypothetical protein